MAKTKRSTRAKQPAALAGLGIHYKSPIKPRDTRKRGLVQGFGHAHTSAAAFDQLDALLRGDDPPSAAPIAPSNVLHTDEGLDTPEDAWMDVDPPPAPFVAPPPPAPLPRRQRPRRPAGDAAYAQLNSAWSALLPSLEIPWARYYQSSSGQPRDFIPAEVIHDCTSACEGPSSISRIRCLYTTHIQHVTVKTCNCKSVAVLLVEHGVFPASPTKPKTGISIDLLDFYRALFERSCDAVTALAAALHTVYERRGFRITTERTRDGDSSAKDPFRRLLTQAVQWSWNLRSQLERKVEFALADAQLKLAAELSSPIAAASSTSATSASATSASATSASATSASASPPSSAPSSASDTPASTSAPAPASASASDTSASTSASASAHKLPGRAHRTLVERCPACFNLTVWGRSLEEGGDCQNGADGCFSYRHDKAGGDGPISYTPRHFLPKSQVAAVRRRLALARKKPAAKVQRLLPQEVIDSCEESWEAANEKKRKADPERYDSSGVFVMTCRHGQVIFLCDIDTPGEQQCYIVAMLEELFSMLPLNATVKQAYDVACVTDYSLNLYPILPENIRSRVSFVINGMHAYGHQWACQLVYSPRFHTGMGLSDHEGVERYWSRTRKLIPLTRNQWSSRRIWMLDLYATFVGEEGRANLGTWISRQQDKNISVRYRNATKVLEDCRITERELRAQWVDQKAAQTSIRAHAPARLRRELDKVLVLQTQIDSLEKVIEETKSTLKTSGAPKPALTILQGLQATHEKLSAEADALYGSLNIQDTYPELRGLPLAFTQTLLVMRDLKINIRKRATGSFMEWETLDRAVSGRREALGTKLHQSTRKAISRRQPALLKAINKFNACCASLEELRPPRCSIPIPTPLSTQLNGLRNDVSLHEDVWITPSEGPIPRWLNDEGVREGIRNLHALDRCAEEVIRLNLERDNLRRWLSEEKSIALRAKEILGDSPLVFYILQREQDLEDMGRSWKSSLKLQDIHGRYISDSAQASATSSTPFATSSTASATPFATSSTASATTSVTPRSRIRVVSGPSSSSPIQNPFRPSGEDQGLDADEPFDDDDPFEEGEAVFEFGPDPGDISDEEQVIILEEVLNNSDDEEETETSTAAAERSANVLDIRWTFQPPSSIDMTFVQDLTHRNASLTPITGNFSHFVVRPNLRALEITPHDLRPFALPTGRLNGFGLNGCAASLLNINRAPYSPTKASADRCAVFSTYDLGLVRFKGSDPDLWRHISPTEYWDKPVWLIPIHRKEAEHWVLVVVLIPTRQLLFFDSLASAQGWRQNLVDVMLLITRLVALANRNRHPLHVSTEDPTERWEARPLFEVDRPRQFNDYDCGLWVLSMMAAFMRGHEDIPLSNVDMPGVRTQFRRHLLTLSIT
ncbi:hypothetical protein R3P38DRAFT_3409057 [Favolaschia claudopus]|uniref:Ubiquitin-like protease family profile domain-containing protein n=1 Tax=Favolaschia claudopus TaxID=2862362 RepID=A0AAV9ZTM4_9AGAR